VGDGVQDYSVGDRVAAYIGEGAFAEYTLAAEKQLAKLPDSVSTKDGATVLLQGLTCLTMIREAHPVKKGEYVLVHAAAGGTGLLLCQMCVTPTVLLPCPLLTFDHHSARRLKHAGAHVIGTVSTPEKAELAKQAGAEHVFIYKKETLSDVIQKIKAVTPGGEGVHAVLDGVGKDTFESGFEVARRKATLVTFGNASGAVEPFAPLKLAAKNLKGKSRPWRCFDSPLRHGSVSTLSRISVIRPVLNNYVLTKEEMQTYSRELFELYSQGAFKLSTWKDGYPFTADGIRQAQDDLSELRSDLHAHSNEQMC
jgi:NADPH2:quinone reductase